MFSSSFFQIFWLFYVSIMGLLGITIGMDVGVALIHRDWISFLTAFGLAGMTGALCVLGEESRQALVVRRPRP